MTASSISPKERIAQIDKRLSEINQLIETSKGKDWTAYAEEVMKKFFASSTKVKSYLDNCVDQATKYSHVVSPAGRVRNLWRNITGLPSVVAAASRRAQNSPIQGFSSEAGCVAAYNTLSDCYWYLKEFGSVKTGFPKYCRAVHDANYWCVPYETVIPFLHIFQHNSSLGLSDWYRDVMKVEFPIDLELEIDIAAHDADTQTWSWALENLAECIFKALLSQIEIKRLDPSDLHATIKTIVAPWKDQSIRDHLFEKFPLQGYRGDMNEHVDKFMAKMNSLYKEWKSK